MLSSWFDVYLTIILTMIIALLVIGIIGNIIIITYFIGKVYKFQIKLASSYHFMTTQVALVDFWIKKTLQDSNNNNCKTYRRDNKKL